MALPDDAEAAHSDIGASSMSRLIACPASFRLAQEVRARPGGTGLSGSSIYAATGSVAHALIEDAITNNYDPARQLGMTVSFDGRDVTVDAEMVSGVKTCIAEYTKRAAGASHKSVEARIVLDPYWSPGRPPVPAFGTADFWAYHGTFLHLDIVDYKNGAGLFVEVHDNPQLYYYAAGVLLLLKAKGLPAPITVDLTVVQPNVAGREPVRTSSTTALDVLMWVDEVLKPTIREAVLPSARLASGAHCRYCPARAGCPALTRLAQEIARRDFAPAPDGAAPALTPAELAATLRDHATVDVHIEALREVAQNRLAAGDAVPGWTLVPSRPQRVWTTNDPVVLARALTDAGHPEAGRMIYAAPTLRSPAQLQACVSPAAWAVAAQFVQSRSSGVRLVPDAPSDTPRPTAQEEFS